MKSPAFPLSGRSLTVCSLVLLAAGSAWAGEFSIIETGSEWRYLRSGNPGNTWKNTNFNPGATWGTGTGPFGYGDDIQYGEQPGFNAGTAANRPITNYFVKKFQLPEGVTYSSNATTAQQADKFQNVELNIARDDAVAIYINGKEIYRGFDPAAAAYVRDNLPPTNLTATTRALSPVEGIHESSPLTLVFDPEKPVVNITTGLPVPFEEPITLNPYPAENSIAIELHQASATTADARFDLEMNLIGRKPEFGMARPGVPGDFSRQGDRQGNRTTHIRPAVGQPGPPDYDYSSMDTELQWQITNPSVPASWDVVTIEYVTSGDFPDGNPALGFNPLENGSPTWIWKSEPIDLRNFTNVSVTAKLLAILRAPTVWAATDKLTLSLRYSANGITYTNLPWVTIGRSAATEIPTAYTDLVAEDAAKRAITPTSAADPAATWKELDFDDSSWKSGTAGAGYENNPSDNVNFTSSIDPEFDFKSTMTGTGRKAGVYVRSVFPPVADLATATALRLRVKYDDGFVAYINGQEVLRKNVTGTANWNTNASATHADADALIFEEFDINSHRNKLSGTTNNILAIHGMDATGSSDMIIWAGLQIGRPDNEAATPTLASITGTDSTHPFSQLPAKSVPDGARVLEVNYRAELKAGTAAAPSSNKAVYIEDMEITGTPVVGDRFDSYMKIKAPEATPEQLKAGADLDGDSIANILEYAFGSDPTVASLTSPVTTGDTTVEYPILPEISIDSSNHVVVKFRMQGAALTPNTEDGGYNLLDINVRPQIAFDGFADGKWFDRNFEQVGDIVETGDGSVTVTCRTLSPLTTDERKNWFVRIRVGVRYPAYLNGREATPAIFN